MLRNASYLLCQIAYGSLNDDDDNGEVPTVDVEDAVQAVGGPLDGAGLAAPLVVHRVLGLGGQTLAVGEVVRAAVRVVSPDK